MDMFSIGSQSLFYWSKLTFATLGFSIFSFIVWWIVRKRLRDFWMPIVRILELPISRLPRIIIKKPPMIPFIAFVLSALALTLWTARPSVKVFSEFEPGMSQVHVYVDMSPSVSAHISLNDLGQKLVSVLEQIGPKTRVSFGTSHGDEVYEMTTPASAADLIMSLSFHRGGSKIGSGIRAQVSRIGEIDQLFIISDRDQHSWGGFQWQYLLVDADVRHVDVDGASARDLRSNVFIQDAHFLSVVGSRTMDWEIEISEGVLATAESGTLTASYGGESLASVNWEIPAGRRHVTIAVSWPSMRIPQDQSREPIEWNLEVVGGDSLALDNKFRTPVVGRRDRVIVMGEPTGELRLEDYLAPLETALQVSGYDVSRFDRWPSLVPKRVPEFMAGAQFLVALSGEGSDLGTWCPVIEKERGSGGGVSTGAGAGRGSGTNAKRTLPIWITPRFSGESFTATCRCVAEYGVGITMDMCDERLTREGWVDALVGVGAKQIGGEVGAAREGIAMKLLDRGKGVDLTLFMVPLRPNSKVGLTWGGFPILIKQLAAFTTGQGPLFTDSAVTGSGAWYRLADVTQASEKDFGAEVSKTQVLRETNVPVGESMLASVSPTDLPPSWSAVAGASRGHAPNKRDSEDPWPWVRAMALIVVLAMIAEIIWMWRRVRAARMDLVTMMVMLPLTSLFIGANSASAQVHIDWMTGKESTLITFQTLAHEVSSRTSLEMSPKPDFFNLFDESAAERPWIWTATVSKLADTDGRISSAGRLWLKRGGILIVDGQQPNDVLEKLFEPLMRGTVNPSGWMAMPPDHEFMRSFYLLNSLPTCKGRVWRIFSFDGRVAAIASPYPMLASLQDQPMKWACESTVTYEQQTRIFVNLMMMAFTTDYKRDQIHLPEILKRLRAPL
jgi:Domain of unknown function (DUF4159)